MTDHRTRFTAFGNFIRDPQTAQALTELYGSDWKQRIVGMEITEAVFLAGFEQILQALDRLQADRAEQARAGDPPALITEQNMNLEKLIADSEHDSQRRNA